MIVVRLRTQYVGSLGIAVITWHIWRCSVSRIANPTYRWRFITTNPRQPGCAGNGILILQYYVWLESGLRRHALHSREIPFFVDLRNIIDQALGVRLFRMQNHTICRSTFNKFSMLHNKYAVRNIVRQANIMVDENNRHPDFLA